jgi:hypothetical protein
MCLYYYRYLTELTEKQINIQIKLKEGVRDKIHQKVVMI